MVVRDTIKPGSCYIRIAGSGFANRFVLKDAGTGNL